MPSRRAMVPIAGDGSNAVELVVPWLAHTQNGCSPAALSSAMAASSASGRMAKSRSTATTRIRSVPIPAIRSPFSIDEWAWAVV